MKTISRNIIAALLVAISFTNTQAQTANPSIVRNVKVSVQNDNLMINWVVTEAATADYYEVQASADGKTFSTIGLVLGADPKQANSFAFKQGVKKMKPGQVFYRVLNIGTDGKAYASNVTAVK